MTICEKYKLCGNYDFNSTTCNERGISPSCGRYKNLEAEEDGQEKQKSLMEKILEFRL